MNIIFEGADNSGKSTLAAFIAQRLGRPLIHSGGPPKYPGEMRDRIRNFASLDGVVFDRHPCVSQRMYGRIRKEDSEGIDEDMLIEFYDSRPLFVYCHHRGLSSHQVKDHETLAHVAAVEAHHLRIAEAYDQWAHNRAQVHYRVGDSMHLILNLVKGALA